MKKGIHPKTQVVTVSCIGCKATYQVVSTRDSIKIELCAHCHPFYTGEQKIVDTANKVKEFERRKAVAAKKTVDLTPKKERKGNRVTEIKEAKPLTLRDMLKSLQ